MDSGCVSYEFLGILCDGGELSDGYDELSLEKGSGCLPTLEPVTQSAEGRVVRRVWKRQFLWNINSMWWLRNNISLSKCKDHADLDG